MLAHDAVDRRKLGFFKQKFGASIEQLYIFLVICFFAEGQHEQAMLAVYFSLLTF